MYDNNYDDYDYLFVFLTFENGVQTFKLNCMATIRIYPGTFFFFFIYNYTPPFVAQLNIKTWHGSHPDTCLTIFHLNMWLLWDVKTSLNGESHFMDVNLPLVWIMIKNVPWSCLNASYCCPSGHLGPSKKNPSALLTNPFLHPIHPSKHQHQWDLCTQPIRCQFGVLKWFIS